MDTQAKDLDAFNDVKRAIVVCAHADDMETVIGGTILQLVERGVEVYELICTWGDLGSNDPSWTRQSLSGARLDEARRGAELLGVREVTILPHPDGELEPTLALRGEIALHYRKWQPDTVFTFDPSWVGQVHPDHTAAGRAAMDALMPSKMRLYKPEQVESNGVANIQRAFLFSSPEPDLSVDITRVYDRKMSACVAHTSQFPKGEESLQWMRDLDAAAARRSGLDAQYVEQFRTVRVW